MEPATTTTGFPPLLPHVIQDTAVMEPHVIQDTAVMEPATTTTGHPPPLPHVIQGTAVMEPATTTSISCRDSLLYRRPTHSRFESWS